MKKTNQWIRAGFNRTAFVAASVTAISLVGCSGGPTGPKTPQCSQAALLQGESQGRIAATVDNQASFNAGHAAAMALTTKDGENAGYQAAYKPSYDSAYSAAYKFAYDPSFQSAYAAATAEAQSGSAEGTRVGIAKGQTDGTSQGSAAGRAAGIQKGRTAGYPGGQSAGRIAGASQGRSDGYKDGYSHGSGEGDAKGHVDGTAAGYTDGSGDGYDDGYPVGYAQGGSDSYDGIVDCGWRINAGRSSRSISQRAQPSLSKTTAARESNQDSVPNTDPYTTPAEKKCFLDQWNKFYSATRQAQANYDRGYAAGLPENTAYQAGYQTGRAQGAQVGKTDGTAAGQIAGNANGATDGKAARYNDAYKAAYNQAYKPAYDAAFVAAYNAALPAGYNEGVAEGYAQGYSDGYNEKYTPNYDSAYNDGYYDAWDVYYDAAYKLAYSLEYNDAYADGRGVMPEPDQFGTYDRSQIYGGEGEGYDDGSYDYCYDAEFSRLAQTESHLRYSGAQARSRSVNAKRAGKVIARPGHRFEALMASVAKHVSFPAENQGPDARARAATAISRGVKMQGDLRAALTTKRAQDAQMTRAVRLKRKLEKRVGAQAGAGR